MRTLPPCLLTLALTACHPADLETGPAVRLDLDGLHRTGFVEVPDERGPSWAWQVDPSLRVTLSEDPAIPGLFVERAGRSLAFEADWGLGPMVLPVLLVGQRSDGESPLAADDSPGLHLLLAGSAEHGCPPDDLELDLVPRLDGDRVAVEIHLSGMPYLALPPAGTIRVADADGVQVIDAASHEAALGDLQVGGFRWLLAEGGPLGTISLASEEPLPWLQLQGHSGLVEVDVDHSCEASPAVTRAELDLRVVL